MTVPIKIVQSSWALGKIDKIISGRSDTEILKKSAEVFDNFVTIQQGGFTKRPAITQLLNLGDVGNVKIIGITVSGFDYLVIISAGFAQLYNINANVLSAQIGHPTITPLIATYAIENNKIFIASDLVPPFYLLVNPPTLTSVNLDIFWIPPFDYRQDYNTYNFQFIKTSGNYAVGDGVNVNSPYWSVVPNGWDGGTIIALGLTLRITAVIPPIAQCIVRVNINSAPLVDLQNVPGNDLFLGEVAWSVTRGYPRAVGFYQGRLCLAGLLQAQNSFFASAINRFATFQTGGITDFDPISFQLPESPKIYHIVASRTLTLLTNIGEYIFSNQINQGFTTQNLAVVLQSKNGSTFCPPIDYDSQLFYVQSGGNVIRSLLPNVDVDVSLLAPSIVKNPQFSTLLRNLDNNDNSFMLLSGNTDGTAICLQSNSSQQMLSWSRWITSYASILSVTSINHKGYAIIKIDNGINEYSLCQFRFDKYMDINISTAISLVGITYVTGTIELSKNFIGKTIIIKYIDTVYNLVLSLTNCTIIGNYITKIDITETGSKIIGDVEIGIAIDSTMITAPYASRSDLYGDILFTNKKITDVYVYFYNTLGLTVNGELIPSDQFNVTPYDGSAVPVTGIYLANSILGWSYLVANTLTHNQPYPCTVLSLGATLTLGAG